MNRDLLFRVDRFLFAPASVYPLAICRALFCGWLFLWYLDFDFVAVAYHPASLWEPLWFLRMSGMDGIPSDFSLQVLQILWKVSLLAGCCGLASRVSLTVACVLGFYLLGLTHSFQKVNHSDAGLLMAFGVLAFSRSGDAISLDRLIHRLRDRSGTVERSSAPSGEYRWPMILIQGILVGAMFIAGISKLLACPSWVFSDNMYHTLVWCQLSRDVPLRLNLEWPWLLWACQLAALGTVIVEILAPLAFINRFLKPFLILGLLAMQVGILVVMGDNFTQFMALYLFWLPWNCILDWVGKRKSRDEMTVSA